MFKSLAAAVIAWLFIPVFAAGSIGPRIRGEIKDSETFRLAGSTKPMLVLAHDEGRVSGSQAIPSLTLRFKMTDQQQQDLEMLLRQQQTPGAAQFHKFLTPEQFGERFGPNPDDVDKVVNWLQKQGFSDVQVGRSRMSVRFAGTVSNVENSFHTAIHRYVMNGEVHYANESDPMLPAALEGMVEHIRGLNNFRRRPLGIVKRHPSFTLGTDGSHYIAPEDFATIYDLNPLYQSGFDGTGVKIVVVGQSDVLMSDIASFRAAAGLSVNNPTVTVVGHDPGRTPNSGDEQESDLDLEWSGAVARNSSILFVIATDVDNALSYAIDHNMAPVLTISYGLCEQELSASDRASDVSEYQQANGQGMTITASSGDDGAADCDTSYPATQGLAVDEPASLPYVTSVGGTTLNEGTGTYWNASNDAAGGSALSYIPGVVWNDSNATNGLDASGGGESIYYAKPAWQTGLGVPNDLFRNVPDVALAASPNHDPYLFCSNGSCSNGFFNAYSSLDYIGGTSVGAPTFAGIVALIVQQFGAQGNIDPNLYALAASSSDAFHDITSGNNQVACKLGTPDCTTGLMGYTAGIGYDQTTGWGSVDAYRFLSEWTSEQTAPVGVSTGPLEFVPLASPCRVVDTRNPDGPFGGPQLAGDTTRAFYIPSSSCNIPSSALAFALNLTVVPVTSLGYLSIWPSGQPKPLVSTMNSDGRVKATAAVVKAGPDGGVNVYVSDPTRFVMDISGYFVPSGGTSQLEFFPVTPCRIADTRQPASAPYLSGGQERTFSIAGNCGIPSSAEAYSLNFTAIPQGGLGFLSAWPAGASQPQTSILNAPYQAVTANAAIVSAGNGGSLATYASDNTNLVIDVNGYFAPAGSGGLSFYTLSPCRVIDTRNPAGSPPFSGTITVDIGTSGCSAPGTAQAYVLNATVVPSGLLGYLSLWPSNENMPLVSTLNAGFDTVTSNMAIVPSGTGSINAYASSATYLILDIAGYFAP